MFFGAKLAKFVIGGVGIIFVEVSGLKHVSMDIGKSSKRQVILHCKAPVYVFPIGESVSSTATREVRPSLFL